MRHCDNARETVCRYKTIKHWVPSDRGNPLSGYQHRHSVLVFLHRHHILVPGSFSFEIHHNNNTASQSWSLSSPATFLQPAIQSSVPHYIAQGKTHIIGHGRVAWHIIVFAACSNQVQLYCECRYNNVHPLYKIDSIYSP